MKGIKIEIHIKLVRFEDNRLRYCAFSVTVKKIHIYEYIKINIKIVYFQIS